MKWPTLRLSEASRKFAREVASVVLGVLLALGLGEIADEWRWQSRAAQSNAAIDAELALAAGVLDERALVQACIDRRLDELDRLLREARSSNVLPNVGPIGRPPSRPVPTAAWDDAVASGALMHFSDERRSRLSLNYPLVRDHAQKTHEEHLLWAALRILEALPGPASDELLTEAAVTLARLRYVSDLNGVTAGQTTDSLNAGGVGTDYLLIEDREGMTRAEVVASVRDRAICRPLSATRAG